jgi:hypothetical protein
MTDDELDRSEIRKFAPLTFYERHGLVWGAADLFAVGLRGSIARMGEFAALLQLFSKDGQPMVSEIVIIWSSVLSAWVRLRCRQPARCPVGRTSTLRLRPRPVIQSLITTRESSARL